MQFLKLLWLASNILLIVLIFIRNPNEQSLDEILSPLNLFESSSVGAKVLDRLIIILTIGYFFGGWLLTV